MGRAMQQRNGLPQAAVSALASNFQGQLILPADDAYDEARAVYNGMFDKRPALIARCTGTADVRSAIEFARTQERRIAVRGGGHNVAGFSTCEDGVLIDLKLMKGVVVDPRSRTSVAQPGLTWAEFDRETQQYGLATTGGVVSTTGIAGFSLVGGLGWLTRKAGITVDNVLAVNLVTADGELVYADGEENADLLWGVRGAGTNFGVVTSFEHQLHHVGPTVYAGSLMYDMADTRKLLEVYREHAIDAPDDLTIWIAWLTPPPGPHELAGKQCVALAGCWAGDPDRGESMLAPYRTEVKPLVDNFGRRPYLELQSMLDRTAPHGKRNYWKADYMEEITDDAISVIEEFVPQLNAPFSQFHVGVLGGAYGRIGEDATAFRRRDARFFTQYITVWDEPTEDARHIGWTRDFFEGMRPHVSAGVYLNFEGDEGHERVREAYGPGKFERLVALKRRYDPENVFCLNQNIPPDAA